ncbi:hypothetical protein [uncultured Mycobacterium sp.]|uniref:hypothetical protein n=1 Tax=uncultured Mycobacterium sp. TaxID=171292 RepID=UPI0035CA11EB
MAPPSRRRQASSRADLGGGVAPSRSPPTNFGDGANNNTRTSRTAAATAATAYKQLVVEAAETDTVLLNREARPSYRVLRTTTAEELAHRARVTLADAGDILDLYFGGQLETGLAFGGQVAGLTLTP